MYTLKHNKKNWVLDGIPNRQHPKYVHISMCHGLDRTLSYSVDAYRQRQDGNHAIISITIDGHVRHRAKQKVVNKPTRTNKAHAPYNFISLPHIIVPAEPPIGFDRYEGNSGVIDVQITTETDLFIRGIGSDFYKLNDHYAIPGSSMRGMIRNLVEIMSYSQMDLIDKDKHLYYRDIRRPKYRKHVVHEDGRIKSQPGYLLKTKSGYDLIDAQTFKLSDDRVESILRINRDSDSNPTESRTFNGFRFAQERASRKIYFEQSYRVQSNYDIITNFSFNKDELNSCLTGMLVVSGHFPNKKLQWVIGQPDKKKATRKVPEKIIRQLLEDTSNKFRKGFLKDAQVMKQGVPCFYISKGDDIKAISHTPIMRIPYTKTIGDKLPDSHLEKQRNGSIDITQSIFGRLDNSRAGKVFFDDLLLEDRMKDNEKKILLTKILNSPKPTSYTHYLVQGEGSKSKDYDDETTLRGYKYYWPKAEYKYWLDCVEYSKKEFDKFLKETGRTDKDFEKLNRDSSKVKMPANKTNLKKLEELFFNDGGWSKPLSSSLKPVPSGKTFIGKIRYDNLTNAELGCLLYALDLPGDLRHKLGMGKPLGLGTIKVDINVTKIDRIKRYQSLDDNGTHLGESSMTTGDISMYKEAFEEYLIEHKAANKDNRLWPNNDNGGNKRYAELYRMLYWNPKAMSSNDWHKSVDYMTLAQFKAKRKLPSTQSVYDKLTQLMS